MRSILYLVSLGNSVKEQFDVISASLNIQPIGILLDKYREKFPHVEFRVYIRHLYCDVAYSAEIVYDNELDFYFIEKSERTSIPVQNLIAPFYEK